jgi:hypothetical protein
VEYSVLNAHICSEPCRFLGKRGCTKRLRRGTKVHARRSEGNELKSMFDPQCTIPSPSPLSIILKEGCRQALTGGSHLLDSDWLATPHGVHDRSTDNREPEQEP